MKKVIVFLMVIGMASVSFSCGKENASGDTEGADLIESLNETVKASGKSEEPDRES